MTDNIGSDEIFKLITVYDEENDSIVIEWDDDHPQAIALGINDWTNERWLKELQAAIDREDLEDGAAVALEE